MPELFLRTLVVEVYVTVPHDSQEDKTKKKGEATNLLRDTTATSELLTPYRPHLSPYLWRVMLS